MSRSRLDVHFEQQTAWPAQPDLPTIRTSWRIGGTSTFASTLLSESDSTFIPTRIRSLAPKYIIPTHEARLRLQPEEKENGCLHELECGGDGAEEEESDD